MFVLKYNVVTVEMCIFSLIYFITLLHSVHLLNSTRQFYNNILNAVWIFSKQDGTC